MSATNLNVNGRRGKMSLAYWRFLCGRNARVGDVHVCEGWRMEITSISGGLVYVAKQQLRKGEVGR